MSIARDWPLNRRDLDRGQQKEPCDDVTSFHFGSYRRPRSIPSYRAFLEAVLDLRPGYRPAFSFPGYWLYADGDPVVHLIPGHGGPADRAGETIDHVGFRLTDHDGMRRKLDGLGIPYSRMELPELGERRLFIRTPTGILLELIFRDTEIASPSAHQKQANDQ